jgi:hypothetical protein
MQHPLLHAPVQQFGDKEYVFRRTYHFVNPAELLQLFALLAEHAQDLTVEHLDAPDGCGSDRASAYIKKSRRRVPFAEVETFGEIDRRARRGSTAAGACPATA